MSPTVQTIPKYIQPPTFCRNLRQWGCTNVTPVRPRNRFVLFPRSHSCHPLNLPTPHLSYRPRPPFPLYPLLRPYSPHHISFLSSPTMTLNSSPDPPQSSAKTVKLVIKGRVQGVCYRDWTVENARKLGLKGWVRNKRDGSVEALFSGNSDYVQEMEQQCRRGPPAAMVTGLDVFPSDEDPGSGFERRPTV
ncbi:Acylphosphatase-like domain [Dillenia turbinata]|uniref:acylphosphatase n=1 Tax=Dillenia turbinata TaxID=194707 RepID=A0AAN8VYK2_9MAGN